MNKKRYAVVIVAVLLVMLLQAPKADAFSVREFINSLLPHKYNLGADASGWTTPVQDSNSSGGWYLSDTTNISTSGTTTTGVAGITLASTSIPVQVTALQKDVEIAKFKFTYSGMAYVRIDSVTFEVTPSPASGQPFQNIYLKSGETVSNGLRPSNNSLTFSMPTAYYLDGGQAYNSQFTLTADIFGSAGYQVVTVAATSFSYTEMNTGIKYNAAINAASGKITVGTSNTTTSDNTPRIMYWYSKVNQHVDANGTWQTDPDGSSGAQLDKLTYCKKWFPNTTSVTPYKGETINMWHDAGNVNNWTNTVISDKCVQGIINSDLRSLTVLAPAGGETYQVGQKITVKWKSTVYGSGSILTIDLATKDASGNSNTFLMSVKDLVNDGTETLTIPSTVPAGTSYAIRMSIYDPVTTLTQSAISNGTFTINSSNSTGYPAGCSSNVGYSTTTGQSCGGITVTPLITVTSPNNGGESVEVGQKLEIRWDSNVTTNALVDVYVSDGFYKGEVVRTNNTGSLIYTLGINLIPGSNYKAYVSLVSETPVSDSSDNSFTIKETAETSLLPAGCTSKRGYSMTTGVICDNSINPTSATYPSGCTSASGYSTTTGQSCSGTPISTTIPTPPTPPSDDDKPEDCNAPFFTKTLRVGQRNEQVEALQAVLVDGGYLVESSATGYFNTKTKTALREFQRVNGVLVTGYTGSTVRAKLNTLWTMQCRAN